MNSIIGGVSSRGRKTESVTLLNHTRLEVVYRTPSNTTYACYPPRPVPDCVEKEIWEVKDNKLVWVATVSGIHKPAHLVSESIVFPE